MEKEQCPAGPRRKNIFCNAHSSRWWAVSVGRYCSDTGQAELSIHLAAEHTQMEGGVSEPKGQSLLDLDVLKLFEKVWPWTQTVTQNSFFSLYSPSLARLQLLSAVCLTLSKSITLSSADVQVRYVSAPRSTNLFSIFLVQFISEFKVLSVEQLAVTKQNWSWLIRTAASVSLSGCCSRV